MVFSVHFAVHFLRNSPWGRKFRKSALASREKSVLPSHFYIARLAFRGRAMSRSGVRGVPPTLVTCVSRLWGPPTKWIAGPSDTRVLRQADPPVNVNDAAISHPGRARKLRGRRPTRGEIGSRAKNRIFSKFPEFSTFRAKFCGISKTQVHALKFRAEVKKIATKTDFPDFRKFRFFARFRRIFFAGVKKL